MASVLHAPPWSTCLEHRPEPVRPGSRRIDLPVPRAILGSSRRRGGRPAGNRENEPHGRVWPKHATGLGEEQAARVVRNDGGGPQRVWKPATRSTADDSTRTGELLQRGFDHVVVARPERSRRRSRAGKWIPRVGSVEGAWNLKGGCLEGWVGAASRPGTPDGRTDEVLEGECKTTSGRQARWVTNWTAVERKTPWSTPYALCAEVKGRRWEL
jgi:hypothetical protein